MSWIGKEKLKASSPGGRIGEVWVTGVGGDMAERNPGVAEVGFLDSKIPSDQVSSIPRPPSRGRGSRRMRHEPSFKRDDDPPSPDNQILTQDERKTVFRALLGERPPRFGSAIRGAPDWCGADRTAARRITAPDRFFRQDRK